MRGGRGTSRKRWGGHIVCFHARLAFSAAAELRPYYVYIYNIYIYVYTSSFRSSPTTTYSSTAGCCYMENWSVIVSSTDILLLLLTSTSSLWGKKTSRRLDCVLCHGTNSIQCTCWLLHIYGREELSLYFGIMREQNELHTVDRIYLRIIILDLLFCQNIELMLWICFGTKYAQYLILRGCYYTSYLS